MVLQCFGPFSAVHVCRIFSGTLLNSSLSPVPFSIFSSKSHWHEDKFLYILPKTLARIKGARHCLAIVKSKGERESFVHEPFASQDSPARSHSCSLSLGVDRFFLMESSVPNVSKLVLVFAASWDGLRETVCLDLI